MNKHNFKNRKVFKVPKGIERKIKNHQAWKIIESRANN